MINTFTYFPSHLFFLTGIISHEHELHAIYIFEMVQLFFFKTRLLSIIMCLRSDFQGVGNKSRSNWYKLLPVHRIGISIV